MTKEAELIQQYFLSKQEPSEQLVLGIGDDAAVITVPENKQLVVSTDTLVENIHFHKSDSPADIGYKSLAVNLSDMAAMSAEAKWVSLSLTLPEIDHDWLENFSSGFFELANLYDVKLIGGDLSRGPLSITINIQGIVDMDVYVTRSGAKPNDDIYVTGNLGDAGAGLKLKSSLELNVDSQFLLHRLLRPAPRLEIGTALNGLANSMMDLSDGLGLDLQRLIDASGVGAEIQVHDIPLSDQIKSCFSSEQALLFARTSGDDYELCFTADGSKRELIDALAETFQCRITRIGQVTDSKKLLWLDKEGREIILENSGFDHFS